MSDTATVDTATAASDTLFHGVYVPAFVKACSARGLQFDANDVEQVGDLLKMAYALRTREAAAQQQASAQTGGLLKTAAAALEAATFGTQSAKRASPVADAAAFLANDDVRKAASLLCGVRGA